MERAREESQQKEAVLAANVQIGKKKLLTDLAAEESKREEAVKKMQQLRDKEKIALVGSLASGNITIYQLRIWCYYVYFAISILNLMFGVQISGTKKSLEKEV